MANILLLTSPGIVGIPAEVQTWLETYLSQGHKFIVGDSKSGDAHFHKLLSSIGALDSTKIYCMDKPVSNTYDIAVKVFTTSFNEEAEKVTIEASDNSITPYEITGIKKEADIAVNREWYEFRDKQMINDCSMAIAVLNNGDISKRLDHIITLLNMSNKPCYIFRLQ